MARPSRHPGFTLVELLVVIAIVALLLALMLPAVQAARATARKTMCVNRMKQIGLAIHNYHSSFDQFPPSKWGIESTSDPLGRRKHHILSFILPFMEQESLYEQIDFSKHWFDNDAVKTHMSIYHCPESPRHTTYGNREYFPGDYTVAEQMYRTAGKIKPLFDNGIVTQRSSLFGMLQPADVSIYNGTSSVVVSWSTTAATVTDGLSFTMMFIESAGRPHAYKQGRQLDASTSAIGGADWASNSFPLYIEESCGNGGMQMFNCSNRNEIYSFHYGGANFVYGDGAVRFHVETMHPEIFISLFTAFAGDQARFE